MIKGVYKRLPEPAKPFAEAVYDKIFRSGSPELREEFIEIFFRNVREFEDYANEFDISVANMQSERMDEFYEMVPENQATFGGMNMEQARCLYAIIRSKRPEVIVETGVCNGVSTLVILMAIERNQIGTLYSIDYPTFSDDPMPEFQARQYPDDHTFSAIPKGKSPGWIIPDRLRGHWELRTGKSQRELPPLLAELEKINMFIHDSDHTFPCMMFEYEIAWDFLKSPGILLSDDINTNNAFETFGETRTEQYGEAYPGLGYALKQ